MFKVTLHKGLKVGEKVHNVVTLRELNAGDVLKAMEESERVVLVPTANGLEPSLLMSNSMMGVNTLRRQIVSIGEIQGPIEREQLDLLSDRDLDILNSGVSDMEKAIVKALSERGRSSATSTDD
jgi:phage FluMu protein gp41